MRQMREDGKLEELFREQSHKLIESGRNTARLFAVYASIGAVGAALCAIAVLLISHPLLELAGIVLLTVLSIYTAGSVGVVVEMEGKIKKLQEFVDGKAS